MSSDRVIPAIAQRLSKVHPLFDMSRPTAAQLLARLRAIYEQREGRSLSDEKLAGKLPISLSAFNRWKKGDTQQFNNIVEMLEIAGWLNTAGDLPSAETDPDLPLGSEDAAALLLGQAEGLVLLREIHAALANAPAEQTPAAPQKKAASRRKQR